MSAFLPPLSRPAGDSGSVRTLDNGVRVFVLPEPDRSAAVLGVWVEHGSRYEAAGEAGLAHLLEHMLFKGTRSYSVRSLAEAMDRLGHEVEAWTGRELTAFSLEVLREDAGEALGLLCEMVAHPTLPGDELSRERTVVAAEAAMVREDPEAWLLDELVRAAWPGHPAGTPVVGDPEGIARVERETLAAYHRRHYTGDRILVGVAGDVDPDAVAEQCARELGDLPRGGRPADTAPVFAEGRGERRGHTEQVHLALCAPGPGRTRPERFAAGVANHVLGASVTSRLFRELREDRGLAYTVYSDLELHRDCGLWIAYLACPPEEWRRARDLVGEILEDVLANGLTAEEIGRARHGMRAGLLRQGEALEQRLHQAAGDLLYHGRRIPREERLDLLGRVDQEAVHQALGAWARIQELCLAPRAED